MKNKFLEFFGKQFEKIYEKQNIKENENNVKEAKTIINNKEIKKLIYRFDNKIKQLIVFNDKKIYVLPFQTFKFSLMIDLDTLEESDIIFIVKNIILNNKLRATKLNYNGKINRKIINNYPILFYILLYLDKVKKDSSSLDDYIKIIDFENDKIIDATLKEKIFFIFKNHK